MNYTADFFIQKFENIAEDRWLIAELHLNGNACALGHCGVRDWIFNEESSALINLLKEVDDGNGFGLPNGYPVYNINDGSHDKYQQETPKQRILAALYDIKANEALKQAQQIIEQENAVYENATA